MFLFSFPAATKNTERVFIFIAKYSCCETPCPAEEMFTTSMFCFLTSSTEEADPEVSKEIKEEVEKEEGQA